MGVIVDLQRGAGGGSASSQTSWLLAAMVRQLAGQLGGEEHETKGPGTENCHLPESCADANTIEL